MTALGVRPDAVADEFLKARLNGDAPLRSFLNVPAQQTRVAHRFAPRAWPPPFIVYQAQAPFTDVGAVPDRVISEGVYVVKAIGRPRDEATLAKVADRIDELLEGASGATAQGYVDVCLRTGSFELPENIGAGSQADPLSVWLHVGALWTIQVS